MIWHFIQNALLLSNVYRSKSQLAHINLHSQSKTFQGIEMSMEVPMLGNHLTIILSTTPILTPWTSIYSY